METKSVREKLSLKELDKINKQTKEEKKDLYLKLLKRWTWYVLITAIWSIIMSLLTGKSRVPLTYFLPGLQFLGQVHENFLDVTERDPQLLHGEELTKSDWLLFQGLEINSDAEGNTDFVSSSVAFSDRLTSVINFAWN